MRSRYNYGFKTLGKQAANLVATLHERGHLTFSLEDVREISGLGEKSARQFADKLVRRGIATRLRPGLFILVPFELGREREYLGSPYPVARDLAGGEDYYISHGSAMQLHQMTTQPQLVVYVACLRSIRNRTILGTEFRFVRLKPEHYFGTVDLWVDKQEKVVVSDLERTVIDGLREPRYCGGLTEVAKGLHMRRNDIKVQRLVGYALRLGVGAVIRRLGYLLETYGFREQSEIDRLQETVKTTAHPRLDPSLPPGGRYEARWDLQLNIDRDELLSARAT